MLRILAVATLLSLSLSQGTVFAEERAPTFGGLHFGASPQAVAAAMSAAGLKLAAKQPDDRRFPFDQRFEGHLKGQQVVVLALFSDRQSLEKVSLTFLTPDPECLEFYRTFKQELTEKYGRPTIDAEHYKYPYNDGDHVGHEETAVRANKAFIAATWDREDAGTTKGGVGLSIEDNLTVNLFYESSRWGDESTRRQKILNSVF